MVQLWVGWGDGAASASGAAASAKQPVCNPLVLHGLQRALSRRDISIFMSSAPGEFGEGGEG